MSDKATELNAANQNLTKLINSLQYLEREYDKAIDHSANYMGNNESIEQVRDAKAMDILKTITSVKKNIELQTQLVQKLAASY
ncbi:hypothetical protein MACH09_47210 [Vibrio sp. MACH09]|uniref:hypothetical protein n=1 Tax=Vibrio sp. MACH09 TaxID=3025122 RepID=UPI0027911E81|nr:hypothetical protein [Vibrio sp. MACH09]GLO64213.1 hypothetical protein MACH09_47210 [Vibrio sp. MACH09]